MSTFYLWYSDEVERVEGNVKYEKGVDSMRRKRREEEEYPQ
jgi:hypothetical protein